MRVHMTMQGKGGVGKSLIAGYLAQYYLDKKEDVLVVDTDPVNATLKSMPALKAVGLELLDGNRLNPAAFDDLVEMILAHNGPVVVDNGASCFIPLSNYLAENPAVKALEERNRTVTIHSVLTGGPSYLETLDGFAQIVEVMPETVRCAVWINEYFGPVVDGAGAPFEKLPLYDQTKGRISAILRLPLQTPETFGKDIRTMLERRQTFAEAIEDSRTRLMAKQRLQTTRQDVYAQLALVA